MYPSRLVITADSHTQGEPTRLVIGGVFHVPGATMQEKRDFLEQHHDDLRRSLLSEPRGHRDMFGAFLTPPATEDGHLGVVFMHNNGYLDMCGHGTIGLLTTVVELGLVEPQGQDGEIRIDTPAGRVTGRVTLEGGAVVQASFCNVPSFCLALDEQVEIQDLGKIEVSLAYGGNVFAVVPATAVGMQLKFRKEAQIRDLGMQIKQAANEQLDVRLPGQPEIHGIDIVTFYESAGDGDAAYRQVHVFGPGQIDRSPGGTGTSAMLAYFWARGEVEDSEPINFQGIAGGLFTGRIVKTWQEHGVTYHTPEVAGRAYVTGVHQFWIDPSDPMSQGWHWQHQ